MDKRGSDINLISKTNDRWEQIVTLVDENGYLSVSQLSELCHASEITIRRDLDKLNQLKRIQRTHGGATSLQFQKRKTPLPTQAHLEEAPALYAGSPLDQVDAMITTTQYPFQDTQVLPGNGKRKPIIAESLPVANMATCVSIDNYHGGVTLGRWVGQYVHERWNDRANVLNLTYHLPNTQQRSNGFVDGLKAILPHSQIKYSLNAYSRYDIAYQLTRDALSVDREINVIFAINDTNALAAMNACKDLGIDQTHIIIASFGLEGETTRQTLLNGDYTLVCLAMFPELVGPACIEAAIAVINDQGLPACIETPFAVITRDNLSQYYTQDGDTWSLSWDQVLQNHPLPFQFFQPHPSVVLPRRIGVLIRFGEHEWYQNLYNAMLAYCQRYGIDLALVDIEQTMMEELEQHRREIAHCAASQVGPGDVILIDGGPIAPYLADELANQSNITVISNSLDVLEELKGCDAITVIAIGGVMRHSDHLFVGLHAEAMIRELRADKLFLMVTGISQSFGLSHNNIPEVTIKQNLIASAREVFLLADHTCFGRESTIQVAPLTSAHKLITDDGLPASTRLELTKQGLQIIVANMC